MVRKSWGRIWDWGQTKKNEPVRELTISAIKPNPYQPRRYFDTFQLEDLAESIRKYGVIQPILVRARGSGYELIAGERRLRASQSIGRQTIPAIIREATDLEAAEIALIENLQRENLNYFEEAEGYQRLLQEFGLTQGAVARCLGKSQATIANKLRLLKLAPEVRREINLTLITERHARALLKLPDAAQQNLTLQTIYEQGLNVRETEMLIEKQLASLFGHQKNKRTGKIVCAIRDMRIYLNTVKEAVRTVRQAGVAVKMCEKDCGPYQEIRIQIFKP